MLLHQFHVSRFIGNKIIINLISEVGIYEKILSEYIGSSFELTRYKIRCDRML